MRYNPDPVHPTAQRGVTQIEVLVGMALTAILVLGLVNLWSLVDRHFLYQQLRQQAIFSLNAQTHRLAALYRYTDFIGEADTHTDSGVVGGEGRWIFREDPFHGGQMPGLVVSESRDTDVTTASFDEHQVLYMDYPGPPRSASHRNLIWLNRDDGITAELEWRLDRNVDLADCWKNSCYRMEVSLRYPYRLVDGVGPTEAAELGPVETLNLFTLIGRRS